MIAHCQLIISLNVGLDEIKHDDGKASDSSEVCEDYCQLLITSLKEVDERRFVEGDPGNGHL